MRPVGTFLLGFALAGAAVAWAGLAWIGEQADLARGSPSIGAGFGIAILYLYLLGAAFLAALVGGSLAARWLRHRAFAAAGHALALFLLAAWAWWRLGAARREAEPAAYEASRAERIARTSSTSPEDPYAQARAEGAHLLGPWLPRGGQVEPLAMAMFDGPSPCPAICASTASETAEDLMARLVSDGWTLDHDGADYRQWTRRDLRRPGDGVPVDATVVAGPGRVLLRVLRPGTRRVR